MLLAVHNSNAHLVCFVPATDPSISMVPPNEQTLAAPESLPRPDPTPSDSSPSMLYTILPNAVQSRVPRFYSLRSWPIRSRSQYKNVALHRRSESAGAEIETLLHDSDSSSSRSSPSRFLTGVASESGDPTWKYANQGASRPCRYSNSYLELTETKD